MYKFIQQCRACGNPAKNLVEVFDLGLQPLANDFRKGDEEHAGYAPLKVLFCEKCTLAQLSVVVDPKLLYSTYAYTTSRSKTMSEHFALLWQAINIECNPDSVIEIGSNDGFFLEFCKLHGAGQVCGIDPASNLTSQSKIMTVFGTFNSETAHAARCVVPRPSLVVARHVFAHIDDWQQFVRDLDALCDKDTLVVLEVPYAADTLRHVEFDQVYHEHLSYVSIKAVQFLLRDSPFEIYHVLRFPIHGDSVVIMLRRTNSKAPRESVAQSLKTEQISVVSWESFSFFARLRIESIKRKVSQLLAQGKVVAGYGASAKSSVCITACGFTRRQIAFVTDTTSWKIGRLIPGSDIPVVAEAAIKSEHPDCMICFAWNYKLEILDKEHEYLSNGGQFIFPNEV